MCPGQLQEPPAGREWAEPARKGVSDTPSHSCGLEFSLRTRRLGGPGHIEQRFCFPWKVISPTHVPVTAMSDTHPSAHRSSREKPVSPSQGQRRQGKQTELYQGGKNDSQTESHEKSKRAG